MSDNLPNQLYTCAQSRELDILCSEKFGIPGLQLMQRAASEAFECAKQIWPENRSWAIICGSGHNAGDGYLFALSALADGHQASVFWVREPSDLSGDALAAYKLAKAGDIRVEPFQNNASLSIDTVIVDALLGTGFSGNLKSNYLQAIERLNALPNPVFSLDIPSGLCADSGALREAAINATATMTFISLKTGLLTADGPQQSGRLYYTSLDIPAEVFNHVKSDCQRVDFGSCHIKLPMRNQNAHKGDFGHLVAVGGDVGYGGAALLATEAAAYAGAGMISLATRKEHVTASLVRSPEIMAYAVDSGQALQPLLKKASVVIVGPGLGLGAWSEQLLQQVLKEKLPIVFDADALNLIASGNLGQELRNGSGNHVFTPHPGEASRLLKVSSEWIQQNRILAARKLHQLLGGVIVLKGAGSLIADGDSLQLANVGNPGLSSAGSGDVLSGVIGGLMAQGMNPLSAAVLAVCAHGQSAENLVASTGVAGLRACELAPEIRRLMIHD